MKKQRLRDSKKVIALGIALLNLNIIFLVSVFKSAETTVVIQMMTAILFLVGIYTGVQGGIDMIQSNKMEVEKSDKTETKITKNYEHKMDYVDDN